MAASAMAAGPVDKVYKLTMSRGESDDFNVDLERIEDYVLFDDRDNALRFGDIYRLKKTIIIFLRHPQCFTAKEYMDDLCRVTPDILEDANTQLAVIFPVKSELLQTVRNEFTFPHKLYCSKHFLLQTVRNEFTFPHKLYCDPEGALYKAVGFSDEVGEGETSLASSKHVKSGIFSGVLQSTYRAMWYQDFTANIHLNGGCLLAGPGRLLRHCHRDRSMFDQIPINRALELAGAGVVSFPKDPRVITV